MLAIDLFISPAAKGHNQRREKYSLISCCILSTSVIICRHLSTSVVSYRPLSSLVATCSHLLPFVIMYLKSTFVEGLFRYVWSSDSVWFYVYTKVGDVVTLICLVYVVIQGDI